MNRWTRGLVYGWDRQGRSGLLLILAWLAFLTGASASPDTAPPSFCLPSAMEDPVRDDPWVVAEAFYAGREKPENVMRAAAIYEAWLRQKTDDAEAGWRLARCYLWLARHSAEPARRTYGEAARTAASRAYRASPRSEEALFWYAASLSPLAEETVSDVLAAGESIRALERLVALNPRHGLAQYWLSVLYRKTPGWPLSYGDLQKSLTYAQLSLVNSPGEVFPLLGLAETLLALDKSAEARALLAAALTQPGSPQRQPEAKEERARAQRLLEALEKGRR